MTAAAAAYEDDDDGGGVFYPPKDSIIRFREKRTIETRPFRCDGTLLRHVSKPRDPSTVCSPHDVAAATASSPVVRVQGLSTIESLTPFDRDVYDRIDWTKCESCAKLDDTFLRAAEVGQALAFADALRSHLLGQRREVEDRKRKRQDEKAVARAAVQSAVAPHAASAAAGGDPRAAALAAWASALSARCSYPQLKALCEANNVSARGAKAELVLRLAHIKHHGGPGLCPSCKHPLLAFTYSAGAGLYALPTGVSCSTQGRARRRCVYQTSNTAGHAVPLVDSPDGALAAAGLQAGPLDADAVLPSAAAAAQVSEGDAAEAGPAGADASAAAAAPAPAPSAAVEIRTSDVSACEEASMPVAGVRVVRYSERAIVVLGDTRPMAARMRSLGGVWNNKLTVNGERAQGWVFRAAERARVEAFLSGGTASAADSSARPIPDTGDADVAPSLTLAAPLQTGSASAADPHGGDAMSRAEAGAVDEGSAATDAGATDAVAQAPGALDAPPASPAPRFASSATITVSSDGRLHVGGNTYLHRHKWKALGGRWLADAKVWVLPASARQDVESILLVTLARR